MARGRPRKTDIGEVLDTAMKLFWEQGYEATSVNDVAAKTGMAKPGIYANFGNKDMLYSCALKHYVGMFQDMFATLAASDKPTAQAVRDFLETAARANTAPEGPSGCFLANALIETAGKCSDLTTLARELNAARNAAFRQRFQSAADNGELPEALADKLAAFFSAQALALAALASSGSSYCDLISVIDVAMTVIPSPTGSHSG